MTHYGCTSMAQIPLNCAWIGVAVKSSVIQSVRFRAMPTGASVNYAVDWVGQRQAVRGTRYWALLEEDLLRNHDDAGARTGTWGRIKICNCCGTQFAERMRHSKLMSATVTLCMCVCWGKSRGVLAFLKIKTYSFFTDSHLVQQTTFAEGKGSNSSENMHTRTHVPRIGLTVATYIVSALVDYIMSARKFVILNMVVIKRGTF